MPTPFRWKEAALLLSPLLVFVAVGVVLQGRKAIEMRLENDFKGPYRAVITRIEPLQVTAYEAAAGFDTKLKIYAKELGRPQSVRKPIPNEQRALISEFFLVSRYKGRETRHRMDEHGPAGFHVVRGENRLGVIGNNSSKARLDTPEEVKIVLANTSSFPPGAEVRLQGNLKWNLNTLQNGRSVFFLSQLSSVSRRLRAPYQNVSVPSFPRSDLKITTAQIAHMSPNWGNAGSLEDGNNAVLHIFGDGPEYPHSEEAWDISWIDPQIVDAEGRKVAEIHEPLSGIAMTKPRPQLRIREWFAVPDVPASRGELRFTGKLSWFGTAPVPISIVARPAWVTKRPPHLKLQSVKVKGSNVEVMVSYTGSRQLLFVSEQGQFFDNRDDYFNPLIDQAWHDTKNDYLLTNWSQHLTVKGRKYFSLKNVSIKDITPWGNGLYRITYKTNAFQIISPGGQALFKADIGLKGEGFLPIQAVITK